MRFIAALFVDSSKGIVFAKDRNHAEELVRKMISDYPIKPEEHFSIIGGSDKTLEEIYNERPELNGITPERGYIYNEFVHRNYISRMFAKGDFLIIYTTRR